MSRNRVILQIDPKTELPIRIFRIPNESFKFPPEVIREWPKRDAVESIRRQVFARAGYECEGCGTRLTWNMGHLHEQQPKGNGGEVSLTNCRLLCFDCHEGRGDSEHGDRRWGGRNS
jgi:5-methylcytosine-specific restriction endonuclease McrA